MTIHPGHSRIKSMISKWFTVKTDFRVFVIIAATGIVSSFATFHLLDGYKYNSGKSLAGVFIPPFLCVLYLTLTGYRERLNSAHCIKTIILYCLQITPFALLFFQVFQPTPADDFNRYYHYARNMIDHQTLWGGDRLFFPEAGNYYVTQPGYRYFVCLELLVFRNLYRIVSFFNIGLYIIVVFYFQKVIQQVAVKKLQVALLSLTLFFTPYAIKNLLMGLPEWLTVLMLMTAIYCYIISGRTLTAFFMLGLVPFFRQNLLVTTLLLAIGMMLYHSDKIKSLACFLIPLFLPVYHNLYYAGEWRFFVDIFQMPFLTYSYKGNITGLNYALIIGNVMHYAGLNMENGKVTFSLIALLFLPFTVLMYFLMLKELKAVKPKVIFILITMSAIVPVIFLGSAYYPRFEFVNAGMIMITYLLLATPLPSASKSASVPLL